MKVSGGAGPLHLYPLKDQVWAVVLSSRDKMLGPLATPMKICNIIVPQGIGWRHISN